MASSATTLKFFSLFFVVVFVGVVSTQAQDLGLSPAPAPGPNAGVAGCVTCSVTMIGASIVLSMFALLKH
jgi:hypothetical protein